MEAVVEYNYKAQQPDELTLRKGDIIKDIKKSSEGWWEGTLGDKRGMFPDNFVKVIDQSSSNRHSGEGTSPSTSTTVIKNDEVMLRNGSGRKLCKVLFSYDPVNDDELTLVPNECIEYLGEVEEGWWKGRIKGKIGVFPSNFVTTPVLSLVDSPPENHPRKIHNTKAKDKKEYFRVLYPYQAANEDELTLKEGDIITLITRDAPDKGWWKGELKGQCGLFPDNFVEVITVIDSDNNIQQESSITVSLPTNTTATKSSSSSSSSSGSSSLKRSNHVDPKRSEKALIRKSLDTKNIYSEVKKNTSPSSTNKLLHSNVSVEKKHNTNTNLITGYKKIVGDNNNINSNSNNSNISNNGNGTNAVGEELDEVERGEGAPLSHLTALRAKAPKRRLPTTQHLRHQNASNIMTAANNKSAMVENNITNGNAENILETSPKDDENDGALNKSRKKVPWVEELKMNQLERRKFSSDKEENKTDHHPSLDNNSKLDFEEFRSKDKEKLLKVDVHNSQEHHSLSNATSPSSYVPYHLYSKLLDRIAVLEEKQTVLQHTVNQLSEQLSNVLASEKN